MGVVEAEAPGGGPVGVIDKGLTKDASDSSPAASSAPHRRRRGYSLVASLGLVVAVAVAGFLLLGVILMLFWRGAQPQFFRRRPEDADPALIAG